MSKGEITYGLRKWVYRGKCTVVQKLNGHDVNEYDAYEYYSDFILYPRHRIIPSAVPLKKQIVKTQNIRREF